MSQEDFRDSSPITDFLIALELLSGDVNGRTERFLMTPARGSPFIEVLSFGREHEEYLGSQYFPLTQDLATLLKDECLVEGQRSGAESFRGNCVITPRGSKNLALLQGRFLSDAHAFLETAHIALGDTDVGIHYGVFLDDAEKKFFVSARYMTKLGEEIEVRRYNDTLRLVKYAKSVSA